MQKNCDHCAANYVSREKEMQYFTKCVCDTNRIVSYSGCTILPGAADRKCTYCGGWFVAKCNYCLIDEFKDDWVSWMCQFYKVPRPLTWDADMKTFTPATDGWTHNATRKRKNCRKWLLMHEFVCPWCTIEADSVNDRVFHVHDFGHRVVKRQMAAKTLLLDTNLPTALINVIASYM